MSRLGECKTTAEGWGLLGEWSRRWMRKRSARSPPAESLPRMKREGVVELERTHE